MPQNSITVDSSIVSWLLAAAGSLIMFILGIGIKDLHKKLDQIDEIKMDIERIKSRMEQNFIELNASIRMVELRIEDNDRKD